MCVCVVSGSLRLRTYLRHAEKMRVGRGCRRAPMYVGIYVRMYVRMYVCVCMYVCMYVCMHVCMYMFSVHVLNYEYA